MKKMYAGSDSRVDGLKKELRREAQKEAAGFGKDVSWLRFARRIPGTFGYRIIAHRQKQFRILRKIADKVAPQYQEFTQGQIADTLGELVNHTQ